MRACRWNRRRARLAPVARERLYQRRIRIWRVLKLQRAQEEIRRSGPPQAPWQRFPEIPNSVSIGWRMGTGESYLDLTFFPWWHSLSRDEQLQYLDATAAPRDWRELLMRHRAKR